jgi:hypothetical protein
MNPPRPTNTEQVNILYWASKLSETARVFGMELGSTAVLSVCSNQRYQYK